MTTDPDTILIEAEETMKKSSDYLRSELRGIRTGRASSALVEFLKVDYYGSMQDMKNLASISVPEPSQLLIKPFDVGAIAAIRTAIETSGLGLNPIVEQKHIRLNVPALSADRRVQLATRCKKLGEESKVAIRNVRRDANKHADGLGKAPGTKHYPEDEITQLKDEIQKLLKKYEDDVDKFVESKTKEIQTI